MPQTLRETILAAQLKFDLEVRDMIAARPDLPYRDIGRSLWGELRLSPTSRKRLRNEAQDRT
jgi:hypothetical protein